MFLAGYDRDIGINIGDSNVHMARKYSAAGFTSAELDLPTFFHAERDMSVFAPYIEACYAPIVEAGLRVRSIHLPFGMHWDISEINEDARRAVVEDTKAVMSLTAALENEILVLHPSAEPIAPEDREQKIDACQKSLEELADHARSLGKTLVLENLPRTCLCNTAAETERITRHGTLLPCCMDTTHLFHETVPQFMQVCGPYIRHTHLSDYITGQDECHFVPGTGTLPWPEIFARLAAMRYQGVYMFEVGGKYAPLEILQGLKNALGEGL